MELTPLLGSVGIYSEFCSLQFSFDPLFRGWNHPTSSSYCWQKINRGHQYVTLKVCERDSTQGHRERRVYRQMNMLTTSHTGALLVRTSLDDFELPTASGCYLCLVHPPLGITLAAFRRMMPGNRMSEKLLKSTLKHILLALDFLHSEVGIIHTGIVLKILSVYNFQNHPGSYLLSP